MNLNILNQLTTSIKAMLFTVIMLFVISSSNAQDRHAAKITDLLVGTEDVAEPFNGAILELESKSKGFLLPRLTTKQRNEINLSTDLIRANGLTIYNIDTDCINYYSYATTKWLSLCGTLPQAVAELGDCTATKLSANGKANLKKGEPLTANDLLYVNVKVVQPGTVDVKVTSTNGYFFKGSSTFTTPGDYTISLEGVGTPMNGSNGDLLEFNVNGKTFACNFKIIVDQDPTGVEYDITGSGAINVTKHAYVGTRLDPAIYTVVIPVDVKNKGYWTIKATNDIEGVSVSGSGTFTTTGTDAVTLILTGTPAKVGNILFSLTTNSSAGVTVYPDKVKLIVDSASFTIDCSNSTKMFGNYTEGNNIGNSNGIQVPIKVTGDGPITMTVKAKAYKGTVAGQDIEFTGVATLKNALSGAIQYITLTASPTKLEKGVTKIVLGNSLVTAVPATAIAIGATLCTSVPEINVKKEPTKFEINCRSLLVAGKYEVGKSINNATNYIEVEVNTNFIGPFTLDTDLVDGVRFTSTKNNFTSTGSQIIRLEANGVFTSSGSKTFMIRSNSSAGVTFCYFTLNVNEVGRVSSRKVTIMTLGNDRYGPGFSSKYAPSVILNNGYNFGPSGISKVDDIGIMTSSKKGAALKQEIIKYKIDIIFISYPYDPDDATGEVLGDFVNNANGFVIYSDGSSSVSAIQKTVAKLTNSQIYVVKGAFSYVNKLTNVNDLILNGSFGDIREKYMGNNLSNSGSGYWSVSQLPSVFTPLSISGKPGQENATNIFKHNTLGFVYIGDNGWATGQADNTSLTTSPSAFTGDSRSTPILKINYGSSSTIQAPVYNSILYGNLLEYAIKYVSTKKTSWENF